MQKSYFSFIFDFLFICLLLFFITFIWVRSIIHNTIFIWLYSILISVVLSIFIFTIFRKKIDNYKLNKEEIKTKNNILNQLFFCQKNEINHFLIKFFKDKKIEKHVDFFCFKNENNDKYIIFNSFTFNELNKNDLLNYIKKAEKQKCEKIYIFCSQYNKECEVFIKNLKLMKIKLINFDNFYVNYIKKQNIYPNFTTKYEEKSRYKFKELLSIAFNKNKTKRYLITGLIFLIGSIFLRYNIYYLVFTSIMFIFAMFSYFNNIYNKKIDDQF